MARGVLFSQMASPQGWGRGFPGRSETEHVPALLKAVDWLRMQRRGGRSGAGVPWADTARYGVASLEVVDAVECSARLDSRRDTFAAWKWFGRSGRWL
jgi:hypothetical protein